MSDGSEIKKGDVVLLKSDNESTATRMMVMGVRNEVAYLVWRVNGEPKQMSVPSACLQVVNGG